MTPNQKTPNDDPVLALIAAPLTVADAVDCTVTLAECTSEHVIVRVRAAGATTASDLERQPAQLLNDDEVEYPHVHTHRATGPMSGLVDWVFARPSGTCPGVLRLRGTAWSVRFRFPDAAVSEPPS